MNKNINDHNYYDNQNGYYGRLPANNINFFPNKHSNSHNLMNNKSVYSYQDLNFKVRNQISDTSQVDEQSRKNVLN
jgi:hypothetical protein